MKYGLYDTVDNVWMGDEEGPFVFDSEKDQYEELAETRALMCDAQLGQAKGRTKVREWRPHEVTRRDEKPIVRDSLTALVMLEEGKL